MMQLEDICSGGERRECKGGAGRKQESRWKGGCEGASGAALKEGRRGDVVLKEDVASNAVV